MNRKAYDPIFSVDFVAALCRVAALADKLIDLSLDGDQKRGSVTRELIHELLWLDENLVGGGGDDAMAELAQDLEESEFAGVEMVNEYPADVRIRLLRKKEEEEEDDHLPA